MTSAEFSAYYRAGCLAHDKGLADGTITAGAVRPLLFGGQDNFGQEGSPAASKIPAFGVTMSDGWRHDFHSRAEAEAFAAKHAPKVAE